MSYPKSLGSSVSYSHFSRGSGDPLSIPEKVNYLVPQSTSVQKLWEGLKVDDAVEVYIAMHEVDTWPYLDDHYEVLTFEIPVVDIVGGAIGQGLWDKSGLKVKDAQAANYVDVTFRFTPVLRRIK